MQAEAMHILRLAAYDAALTVTTPAPDQLEHMADAVEALMIAEPPSPYWAQQMQHLCWQLRMLADRLEVVG